MHTDKGNKRKLFDTVIDTISGIFLPIASLLSATGIMKGLLAILTATSLLHTDSESYLIFNAMADSLFYFLPVLLAFSAAKKFRANPYTCVVIAGIILYPSLTTAMKSGLSLHLLGIPISSVNYPSSVIPIIMAAGLLAFMEHKLDRLLPDIIKSFMNPLICIIFVSFITLLVFGPIGTFIGDALADGYGFVYAVSPIIAGILLGAFIQPMVIFGLHWAFFLVAMNNISLTGQDTMLALMSPPVFAQAGAALAVMLKSKNKAIKSLCASSALSALFGVTEPAMFGINLPRKKPMLAVCIGGAIGGAIAGCSGARAVAFAFPGFATLPIFFGDGFVMYLISCLIGFAAAFILTLIMKFDVDPQPSFSD